ncbi:MAG: alpha/beta hydrolase [Anaerolineae bacterium]|nr:alpha/beta hydrolase [Anaerolineae bacterium]
MLQEYTQVIETHRTSEEISFLQYSEGERTFIAWHGITSVNRMWYWDILWPKGKVILAGLPGHGPVENYPWAHYAAWTPQHFIDIGIETVRSHTNGTPVTLLGHSTGGMIALGVALQAPELVDRLILIAPVIWSELTGIVRTWEDAARYPKLLRALVAASVLPGQRSMVVLKSTLRFFASDNESFYNSPLLAPTLRWGYSHYQLSPIDGIAGTAAVLSQADLRPLVQECELQVPTLLFHGVDDHIVPFTQSLWLSQAGSVVELVAYPGAGHMLYVERQQQLEDKIKAWLEDPPGGK